MHPQQKLLLKLQLAVAGVIAVPVLAVILFIFLSGRREQDPRSDGSSQSRPAERQAESEYVGTAKCAECHIENFESFGQTGHAQTFARIEHSEMARTLDGMTFDDPERNVTYHYEYEKDRLWVSIPERFPEHRFPLQFTVGSGIHGGISFLTIIPGNGPGPVGLEHRVSWHSKKDGGLGLTPGQSGLPARNLMEWYGKPLPGEITSRCIGCHTTTHEIRNLDLVELRENVRCEHCHGPGREHVAAMEAGLEEARIRFAPGSSTARAEIEMCGECHRLPDEVSEEELVRENWTLARFQSVGMLLSECFLKSGETLRCTTCHNPHEQPYHRKRTEYEQICLSCHTGTGKTSCTVSPEQNCISCHMPKVDAQQGRTDPHEGVAFHDHWIRIRDERDPPTLENSHRSGE